MRGTKILTDIEMTSFIWNHTRGDGHRKQEVKDSWLDFSLRTYDETEHSHPTVFIEKVNKWLKQHHIPATLITFNLVDDAIGGTDWEIEETIEPNKVMEIL